MTTRFTTKKSAQQFIESKKLASSYKAVFISRHYAAVHSVSDAGWYAASNLPGKDNLL